jgi:hypothetical protein
MSGLGLRWEGCSLNIFGFLPLTLFSKTEFPEFLHSISIGIQIDDLSGMIFNI